MQQGKQESFLELTLRLLEKRLGKITVAQRKVIQPLSRSQFEQPGEELLELTTKADLKKWLRENADPL